MAEQCRVALLVPNPFLHIPILAAVRASGCRALLAADATAAVASGCMLVIADLDALSPDPTAAIRTAAKGGVTVLAFAAQDREERLAAARAAGALALPRDLFLRRLPELLSTLRPPKAQV